MKLNAVHHIAVINSDYEKTYDFYVNRLGLEVIFDIARPAKNDRVLMDTNNGINKPVVFFYGPDGTPLELHE